MPSVTRLDGTKTDSLVTASFFAVVTRIPENALVETVYFDGLPTEDIARRFAGSLGLSEDDVVIVPVQPYFHAAGIGIVKKIEGKWIETGTGTSTRARAGLAQH